jgi:uncharacterized SAM-binding protein YcdF (DUF218 family)
MDLGALKPLLTTLLLPPTAPLLLALLGVLLATRKKGVGLALAAFSITLLGVLSCHGTAVFLSQALLPQVAPLAPGDLKTHKVQAIVILGGGVLPEAPEYGTAQPGGPTAARLRYGIWLSRSSGLPVAFTGGKGWASSGAQKESEAEVAARVALEDYAVTLRWLESQSRDTAENARLLAPMLQRDGVKRIALVTDAWHMPRAMAAFEKTGLTVVPAPTGFLLPARRSLMEWIPTASGQMRTYQVLHEWLGLTAGRMGSR